jgi:glycosyltransferase involved in cell wall biosynthesis
MAHVQSLAKRLIYLLKIRYRAIWPKRVVGFYHGSAPPRGRALLSYIPGPLLWAPDDPRFNGHSNLWESAEIARILNRLGYVVDAISHTDQKFSSRHAYDLIFDITRNIVKYSCNHTKKILHSTGSYTGYSNQAEHRRLQALKGRRGVMLRPRRSVSLKEIAAFDESARAADIITLGGNQVTKVTFPPSMQIKIKCLPVTGSPLQQVRNPSQKEIGERDFLWFGGAGAVHKGLDLVLEAFARMPERTLHVIGPYELESDFMKAYEPELKHCRNIISHGYLYPSDRRFREATRKVTAFVFPSCSEGTSTAAITCMQYGFIPIVSNNAGIDIPADMGIILSDCSIEEIMAAVKSMASKEDTQLQEMAVAAQNYAAQNYSRECFSLQVESVVRGMML